MSLSLGNAIAVSTNFIKSNPAVPVYKGEENPNNLFIAEGKLNDEINKYARASKSSIYVKGYYDGLLYVYKAFKRSKELIADNIYKILKREIG